MMRGYPCAMLNETIIVITRMKTPKRSPHPVIPMPDYVRIFRVMRAVMGTTADDSDEACLFMSMTGAAILKHFYKKEARVLAGSAFYLLKGAPRTILAKTKLVDERSTADGIANIDSDKTGFHCWLECDDQVIDFQALVFPEAVARAGSEVRINRQMFQKRKSAMSNSPIELTEAGDFYLQANVALTNELVRAFFASPKQLDLMRGCMTWFTKPPRKIANAMTMRDVVNAGADEAYEMLLPDIDVTGAW